MLVVYLICLIFTSSATALEQYFFFQEEISDHWVADGKKAAKIKKQAKIVAAQRRAEEIAAGEQERIINAQSKALKNRTKKFIGREKQLELTAQSLEEIQDLSNKINKQAQRDLGESSEQRIYRIVKKKKIQFPEIKLAPETINHLYANEWAYPPDPSLSPENNSDLDE